MTSKRVSLLKLHLDKDAPLRKPTPVYFQLVRENNKSGPVCGAYARVGTCCRVLLVR